MCIRDRYYASLAFIALYTLLLYLYKIRKIQMVTAFVLSMGVLVLEMGLNTAVTSVTITSRTDYWKNTAAYQSLLDTIDDSNFYRVEKATRKTKNDGAWVGYRSASVFLPRLTPVSATCTGILVWKEIRTPTALWARPPLLHHCCQFAIY